MQLDAGKQIHYDFGQTRGQHPGDFLQNEIADLPFVLDQPIHGEQPPAHIFHGGLSKNCWQNSTLLIIDVPAVVPVRTRLRCRCHFRPPCEFSLISVAACPACRPPSGAELLRHVQENRLYTECPDNIPFYRGCDRLLQIVCEQAHREIAAHITPSSPAARGHNLTEQKSTAARFP